MPEPAYTLTDAATGETLARVSPADVPGGRRRGAEERRHPGQWVTAGNA
jgi:hypothetical protein